MFQFVCALILLSRLMLIYADSLPDPDAQPDPEALPGPEVMNWHSIYTQAVKKMFISSHFTVTHPSLTNCSQGDGGSVNN